MSRATAWISSTITVSTVFSALRPLSLVTSRYSDSGVVTTNAGGRRTIDARIPDAFNLSTDLEAAANDVRDKVSKSRQQLPTDIEPTIVEKSGPPDFLVFLTVQSDTKSLEDITDFVNINIKERLQSIPGVRLASMAWFSLLTRGFWLTNLMVQGYSSHPDENTLGFGISTFKTGCGRYLPASSSSLMRGQCSYR